MTGSWLQDADKCEQLYVGILYTDRQKKRYECKPDEYAYYVDFNAWLMSQFDHKEQVRCVDDGEMADEKKKLDALAMTRILEYCNRRNRTDEKEQDNFRFLGIHGNSIDKFQPCVDDHGRAWPEYETFNPKFFGISPGATDIDNAVWCFYRRPVPIHELKTAFPDFAEDIKAESSISMDDAAPATSGNGVTATFSAIGNGVQVFGDFLKDAFFGNSVGQQAFLTEFYFKDPEMVDLEDEGMLRAWIDANPGFGTGIFKEKAFRGFAQKGFPIHVKRYPHGRRILTACKLKLEDVANPYPWFPFDMTKCYRRPKEAWAKGVIHKVREPIQNEQMLMAGCAANVDYRQLSAYFATGGAKVQEIKKIPTTPNTVTYLGPVGSTLEPIPVPPVVTQDVMQLSESRRTAAERTGGLESIMGGSGQARVYTGVQQEKQVELAIGKVTPRYKEIKRTRQRRNDKFIWFIQNYMTDERLLEFLTTSEGQKYLMINQMTSENGQPQIQNDVTVGNFQYYDESSENRPVTRAERNKQAQEAADIIAPFAPLLAAQLKLESMDIPGKYELLDKFKVALASKQEQEMRQQQFQMKLAADKQVIEKNKVERELDVKEINAGAAVMQADSWVFTNMLTGLKDAGFEIPAPVLNSILTQVGITVNKVAEETAGDAVGE